ncbi:MAG: ATP-dependent Clp protease proteolytic subunit, partial [Anaerolineales bacterium]
MARRTEILATMEWERGSKVITLMHHRELRGDPPKPGEEAHLTTEDTEHVLMQILSTPADRPIDLILHTPGGLALAAEMISTAVRWLPAKVTVIVPFYAMSGGTLIALAADEILMESYSVLGPLDPQTGGWPAGALIHLSQNKPAATIAAPMIPASLRSCA